MTYSRLRAGAVLILALVAAACAGMAAAQAPAPAPASAPAPAPDADPLPDWGTVLPKADLKNGALGGYVCQGCHMIEIGGDSRSAPRLWGIVGKATATDGAFNYSPALIAFAEKNPVWTYDQLYRWLASPRSLVPGTRMGFGGYEDPQTRINIIVWLRTLGGELPIPPPDPSRRPAGK